MTEGLHDFQFFTLETLVIQTIILLLILWVLNRFVFQPYLQYLDKESEKRKKLESDYNNIEKLNNEAEAKKEALLLQARQDAEQMRKDAADLAKKEAQIIKDQATQEASSMKNSALAEITKDKGITTNDQMNFLTLHCRLFSFKMFNKRKVRHATLRNSR